MQRRLWYIKNAALFSWLTEDELQRLANRSEMVDCKRNTTFFFAHEQSDSIYLVKQGRVKLFGLRRRELEMRLEELIFQPLANRMVLTLLWQARRHGIREDDGSIRLMRTLTDDPEAELPDLLSLTTVEKLST